MTVLIDADGCPVVDITVKLTNQSGFDCVIICDTSHVFEKNGAKTIVVSKGNDSVDFTLVNMIKKGDIVITQDYGLAAMCLARGAVPVNQDGMIFTEKNIDGLLMQRYASRKMRAERRSNNTGGRFKGPSKRTPEQDRAFEKTLGNLLSNL